MIGYIDTTSFPVYTYGEMIIKNSNNYYINWTPSNISTGTFKMEGSTYNFSDYSGSFSFDGGIIQSSAFSDTLIQTLNTNAEGVEECAFLNCISLSSVSLPNCKDIGQYAFQECSSLRELNLPACSNVGAYAFFGCHSLATVSLPACSNVGNAVFYGCFNLTSVYIPNIVSYTQSMFRNCGFSEFYSSTCLSVGRECLAYCDSLITVDLPACRYVGIYAFRNCESLTAVSLQNCSYIDYSAFYNCYSLNTITVGGSSVCRLISSMAFYGTGITSSTGFIYVPHSLFEDYKVAPEWSYFWPRIYTIGYVSYLYSKISFANTTSESSYHLVWVDNTYQGYIRSQYVSSIFSVDRSIYSITDIADVGYYPQPRFSYFETNIPYINWARLKGEGNPSSKYRYYYESNSKQYFNGAYVNEFSVPAIKSVYFPDCSYMSPKHMQNLVSIVSASFPALEFVPYCGFRNCYALPSIDLPACSSIFSYAFANCSSLKEITLRRRFVCYLENSNAFSNTPIGVGSGSIYVPSSLVSSYKSASEWSYFSSQIFPINN